MTKIIERIPFDSLPLRLPDLRQRGLPAVVTDLFRDQVIEKITDLEGARKMLGPLKLSMGINYVDAHLERVRYFIRGVPMPSKLGKTSITFGEYLNLIERDSDTRYVISEEPTPAMLLSDIDFSALGVDNVVGGNVNPYAPSPANTAYSMLFVANCGNSSDLHADGDGRDVLLFQGFGNKRVCLFPSTIAPLLHPVANFSTVKLAQMDEEERQAFLTYANGVEYTIMPGEALFMPAFIWHHFDYLGPSMSVVFRFGGIEDPIAQAVIRNIHLDHNVQNIIVGTRDPLRAASCREAARRLLEAETRKYPSTHAKYRAMRYLAAECYEFTIPINTRRYLGGIIEPEDFLEGGLSGYYSRPREGRWLRRSVWRAREHVRDVLRRWARKIAYWA